MDAFWRARSHAEGTYLDYCPRSSTEDLGLGVLGQTSADCFKVVEMALNVREIKYMVRQALGWGTEVIVSLGVRAI